MMTTERPGEANRRERLFRLLDTLAAVPNRGRRRSNAIRTLGLRLSAREERLLLALVSIWETAGESAFLLPTEDGGTLLTRPHDWTGDDGPAHPWFRPDGNGGDAA